MDVLRRAVSWRPGRSPAAEDRRELRVLARGDWTYARVDVAAGAARHARPNDHGLDGLRSMAIEPIKTAFASERPSSDHGCGGEHAQS